MIYYEYWLDRQDILFKANDAWFEFYAQNNGGGSAQKFIGSSYLHWITGLEVQALFVTLLRHVRSGKTLAELAFRCDSPDTKRLMGKKISLCKDQGLHFKTRLLDSASRKPVHWTSQQRVTMCGWCNRISIPAGGSDRTWMDVDVAIDSMQLLEGDTAPNLTHGICPDCKKKFLEAIPGGRHLRLKPGSKKP